MWPPRGRRFRLVLALWGLDPTCGRGWEDWDFFRVAVLMQRYSPVVLLVYQCEMFFNSVFLYSALRRCSIREPLDLVMRRGMVMSRQLGFPTARGFCSDITLLVFLGNWCKQVNWSCI